MSEKAVRKYFPFNGVPNHSKYILTAFLKDKINVCCDCHPLMLILNGASVVSGHSRRLHSYKTLVLELAPAGVDWK
jgi:hypothetical protein